jgi:hypothetical protein
MDTLAFIMAYENGELSDMEIVEGFRELVRTGLAWQLQGHYGRMAQRLIDAGLICTGADDCALEGLRIAIEEENA